MVLRVAIVGLGFGKAWARAMAWHPEAELVALCDVNRDAMEQIAEELGVRRKYDSLEKLLEADDVDAIGVFTPPSLHVKQAIMALEAGKHVLSAVPAAMTVEECQRLIDAVERTGKTYMMAENWPYTPTLMRAEQLYAEDKLGAIFHAEAEYTHDLRGLAHTPDGKRTWRYGLAPMLYPTHGTGPFVHMTGDRLAEVTAFGATGDSSYDPDWVQVAIFRSETGAIFRLTNSFRNAASGGHYFSFHGTKGSFETGRFTDASKIAFYSFDDQHGRGPIREECDYTRDIPYKKSLGGHSATTALITLDFIQCIAKDGKAAIDVYEAVEMTLPGIMAQQSIAEDRRLEIPNMRG
jgi:predicted dehydrogenase